MKALGAHRYPTVPPEAVLAGLEDAVAFRELLRTFRDDDVDQLVDGVKQRNRAVVAKEFWIRLLVEEHYLCAEGLAP